MNALPVSFDDVRAAAERIRGHVHQTPVFTSRTADALAGARLFFKAETLQRVGAFKARGASVGVSRAKELGAANIRVNAICPGQIMTDLEKWRFGLEAQFFNTTVEEREKEMCKTIPLGYIGEIHDAGSLAAFLASEESRYITGQALNLDGGGSTTRDVKGKIVNHPSEAGGARKVSDA